MYVHCTHPHFCVYVQISVDSPVAVTDRQSTELVIPPPLASLKAKFVPLRILASAPFGLRMAVSTDCMRAYSTYST